MYGAGPVGGSEGSNKASEGIIRPNRKESARFFVVELGLDLVVEGQAKNDDCDRRDHRDDQEEHDGDEPRGAALVLGRWLGDAKGVDEGIRQEKQRAHGDWMILQGQENRLLCIRRALCASYWEAHLRH